MTPPSLLDCYCGERHDIAQCPNLDLQRLVELGRREVTKSRLLRCGWSFKESFRLSNVVGEQHEVDVTGPDGSRQPFARLLSADAWDAALRFASMAQARAEASR